MKKLIVLGLTLASLAQANFSCIDKKKQVGYWTYGDGSAYVTFADQLNVPVLPSLDGRIASVTVDFRKGSCTEGDDRQMICYQREVERIELLDKDGKDVPVVIGLRGTSFTFMPGRKFHPTTGNPIDVFKFELELEYGKYTIKGSFEDFPANYCDFNPSC